MTVIFRPLSAAATTLREQGARLGRRVLTKGGVLNQIFEIFILRAVQAKPNAVVTVIEVPAYLVGGYGGQDGPTDYYSPFSIVDLGAILGPITRREIKLDGEGNPVPNVANDTYKVRMFTGSGRVVIGTVPDWEEFREALNGTTGVFLSCRSAILVAVCPSLTVETVDNHPWARSLTICRVNGYSGGGEVSFTDGVQLPLGVLPGHVMMTSTPPTGRPESISGLEIASDELGLSGNQELHFAGTAIEWGALRGLVAVQHRELSPELFDLGHGLVFAMYEIARAEADGVSTYTGSIVATGVVDVSTLPGGDEPTNLVEVIAADSEFTYPGWATSNTTVLGRDARDGRMLLRDLNLYARLFSASMGYTVEASQEAMTLVEVQCEIESADVSVRGYKSGDPVTFNTVDVPAVNGIRLQTYVASISALGAVSLTKIEDFTDSRYDTAGPLVRKQVQTFGGVTTLPTESAPFGEPRLFCSEWGIRYEIKAAEPDGPAPNLVQGEPERRLQEQGNQFVRLDDLDFYLLSPSGIKTTLAFGDYFPALFNITTSTYDGTFEGRLNFGNASFFPQSQRVGNNFPNVQCQFAPGIMAVLVAPRSGYANNVQLMRVALFSVATGAMLVLSPTLAGFSVPARMSLSCFEQGTVNESGTLLTYGRLLVGFSTLDNSPTRNDGFFTITGMTDISWLAREPSNTAPFYVGNGLVPAEIGVTARLSYIKPTPV
jgi:hypothetical protein